MYELESRKGWLLYRRLRRRVPSQSAEVVDLMPWTMRYAHRDLHPRLFGIFGSAFWREGDTSAAFYLLNAAEALADKEGDQWAVADLWQRKAHVMGDHPDFEQALDLAIRATGLFAMLDDEAGICRTLFDQGLWSFLLKAYDNAVRAYQAVLSRLPIDAPNPRLVAMTNLAVCFKTKGDLDRALKWSRAATHHTAELPASLVYPSRELHAQLQGLAGHLSEAAETYLQCHELCLGHGLALEAARVTVPLCDHLLVTNRREEAERVARANKVLIGQLKGHRYAADAMALLARRVESGDGLDRLFLGKLQERLDEGKALWEKRRRRELDKAPRRESPLLSTDWISFHPSGSDGP